MTCGFLAYNLALSGYTHKTTVIHDPKSASSELPWVHILIANAKGVIRVAHHGVTPKTFRATSPSSAGASQERRFGPEQFDRLLWTCNKGKPLTWSALASAAMPETWKPGQCNA